MFKRVCSVALFCLLMAAGYAQSGHGNREQFSKDSYRATPEQVFDLRHTKLAVNFDFAKRYMYGEEWVTLKPHFYDQSSLTLDAKGMLIQEVKLNGKDLVYKYDGNKLDVTLDKKYTRNDSLTLYIKYTARPEEVTQKGSAAISDAKGLYFIDPDDTDPKKPTQIWTQGETEASSCWFPTIDAPNQKTTQEIAITVPAKYVTLSNGTLVSQNANADGTRTDNWNFPMRHAPYLFYMGIGEFSVVKDKWKDIPVDYYVEKEYEPYAKGIFGNTPEMIDFFSKMTGLDYPWPKYAQMVGRDYVSGAMENTTAVLHADNAYQNDKQLADENTWEDVIAHELFHHWFGDYVTCESWSNLTVNESFANYSEYLWREHKYGRDHADEHMLEDVKGYMNETNYTKDLVRFNYKDKEEMFDGVSYNKGGAILHMLRHFLGNEAFNAGLKKYLNDNRLGTGEAHQLRLAFEAVSGKDLNWFFNQWYFGSGHPNLDITYTYDAAAGQVKMDVNQSQPSKAFQMPMTVDVYNAAGKTSHQIWISKKDETFTFPSATAPLLVNADADHVLLANITENKTLENYIYQLANAPRYLDRKLALDFLFENQKEKNVQEALVKALNDPYHGIREDILFEGDFENKSFRKLANEKVTQLAKSDNNNLVKGAALAVLAEDAGKSDLPLFQEAMKAKSYAIMASGLKGLYKLDKKVALDFAKNYKDDTSSENDLTHQLIEIYIEEKEPAGLNFVAKQVFAYFFMAEGDAQDLYEKGYNWVNESDNVEANKILLDELTGAAIQYKQYGLIPFAQGEVSKIKAIKEKMLSKNSASESLKTQVADADKALDKLEKAK